jgi:ferredoxin
MQVLYFSATGNNLYVAKRLGGDLISIPQAVKDGRFEFRAEKIGLVFPVYFLAVPPYVEQFVRKARLESDYIFAVLTYGFANGGAAGRLQEIAGQSGIKLAYINSIKMVDNYLPAFDMRRQIANEPRKKIEEHLETVISDIRQSRRRLPATPVWNKIMTWAYGLSNQSAIGPGLAKNFRVEDSCTRCGTCVRLCPTENIRLSSAKPQFGDRCMSCLACTHNCPQNAIRLKNERSTARFRNSHVTLKEIIDSNRQFGDRE